MTIKRIQTVYVAADEVAACAAFYEQALGLPVRFRDGERWVQFTVDGVGFAVASRDEAASGAASGAVVVFEATDAADHDRIVAGGASLIGERDMGDHGRTRTYRDPAGNLMQLFWRA